MKIIFIRHGKTIGNIERKYIGSTDQQLCEEGIEELRTIKYPSCDLLICSPMKRCIQTAKLIYPNKTAIVCDDLRECDFGDFENKNYAELSGSEDYQKWIDSNCCLPIPNGESPSDFRRRCVTAFEKILSQINENKTAAFVVHGGTIMSVLEKYAFPKKDFYAYHCENGHGCICRYNDNKLTVMEKI